MTQLALDLGIAPAAILAPHGLFWCCGACVHLHEWGTSLIWQPPDYCVGVCVFCGRAYRFEAGRGGA